MEINKIIKYVMTPGNTNPKVLKSLLNENGITDVNVIINYIRQTPENTNPAVLKGLLDGEGGQESSPLVGAGKVGNMIIE